MLHNLEKPENSIIAIYNGQLSGRSIGEGISETVFNTIVAVANEGENYKLNYEAFAKSKRFRSSSFFIRNMENELIGAFCINVDIDVFINGMKAFSKLAPSFDYAIKMIIQEKIQDMEKPLVDSNVEMKDYISNMINEAMGANPLFTGELTIDEKQELIKKLQRKGVFTIKGAVSEVASVLNVSEPTIYRYMKAIKK